MENQDKIKRILNILKDIATLDEIDNLPIYGHDDMTKIKEKKEFRVFISGIFIRIMFTFVIIVILRQFGIDITNSR